MRELVIHDGDKDKGILLHRPVESFGDEQMGDMIYLNKSEYNYLVSWVKANKKDWV